MCCSVVDLILTAAFSLTTQIYSQTVITDQFIYLFLFKTQINEQCLVRSVTYKNRTVDMLINTNRTPYCVTVFGKIYKN